MTTGIKHSGFEKFYSIFLICSVAGPVLFIIANQTIFYTINSSFIISICICGTYFLIGVRYWQLPQSKLSIFLVGLALFMQSIQTDILGFKFQNYYGPYIAIGYRDDVKFRLDFDFSLLRFREINDFIEYSPDIKIYMNLVSIALLIIFINHKKVKKLEDTFLMDESEDSDYSVISSE
jgi:hypothetical protein